MPPQTYAILCDYQQTSANCDFYEFETFYLHSREVIRRMALGYFHICGMPLLDFSLCIYLSSRSVLLDQLL